jgi:magnesium-transporting ATPase (P-type)
MGITGTDVSKNASDIVLQDDNFATIVTGIAEGRRIDHNIRKVIFSLFSCNVAELALIILAVAFQWGLPLVALQLLLINVFADGLPDLMMCKEPLESDAMKKPPRSPKAGIFSDGLGRRIGMMAIVFTVIGLFSFYVGNFIQISETVAPSRELARTFTFVAFGLASIMNIFNCRSFTDSIFKVGLFSNPSILLACLFSIGLIVGVATIPVLQPVFSCVPMGAAHWILIVIIAFIPLVYSEIYKKIHAVK